jgi:hypothetical protein
MNPPAGFRRRASASNSGLPVSAGYMVERSEGHYSVVVAVQRIQLRDVLEMDRLGSAEPL